MALTERQRTIGVCIALFALTWLVFGQTLRFEFLNYDDPEYVSANPAVNAGISLTSLGWAFTNVHGGNWHPLTSLSHMLDAQLFGLNPAGHHFVNVLLHSAAAVLLFLALRRLSPSTADFWPAAFASAVFALHPLRLESVAWVSERKDVLSAVLFMATLLMYLRHVRRKSLGSYLLLTVVFGLGLMAKPMLVSVPVVLLLLDFWPLGRTAKIAMPRLILEKLPLLVLAGASALATMIAQRGALESLEHTALVTRIGNAAVSVVIYLRQFVWPTNLTVFYPYPHGSLPAGMVTACIAFLLGVSVIVAIFRKSCPYLFVGWFWYLVMLTPVLGLIQVGLQGHADRFTYLPQIGLTIGVAWGAVALASTMRLPRMVLWLSSSLIIAGLALATRAQAGHWRNSEALWNRALSVTSNNDVAHTNLSEICLKTGRPEEAIRHARAALEIYPNNAQAANNLGAGLLRTNRAAEARGYFEQSVRVRPNGVNALQSLAWILAASPDPGQRDGTRAVGLAERANQITGSNNAVVLHTLAASYAAAGRFADAVRVGEEALSLATKRGETGLLPELTFSLQRYRNSQPLRDPGLTQSDR